MKYLNILDEEILFLTFQPELLASFTRDSNGSDAIDGASAVLCKWPIWLPCILIILDGIGSVAISSLERPLSDQWEL